MSAWLRQGLAAPWDVGRQPLAAERWSHNKGLRKDLRGLQKGAGEDFLPVSKQIFECCNNQGSHSGVCQLNEWPKQKGNIWQFYYFSQLCLHSYAWNRVALDHSSLGALYPGEITEETIHFAANLSQKCYLSKNRTILKIVMQLLPYSTESDSPAILE